MKDRICMCGSRVFALARLETLVADYGEEGAVRGHPKLSSGAMGSHSIHCSSCGTKVPDVVADEMVKEII